MLKRFTAFMLVLLLVFMSAAFAEDNLYAMDEEEDFSITETIEEEETETAAGVVDTEGFTTITITCTGDFTIGEDNYHRKGKKFKDELKSHGNDINFTMQNMRSILQQDDMTLVNFEGTFTTTKNVPDSKKDRLSKAYKNVKGRLVEYHGDRLVIRNDGGLNPFESGGAGLFSTVDDYARFGQMLLNNGKFGNKQILTPNSIKYLTSGRLNKDQQIDFDNWQGLEGFTYGNLMRVLDDPSQASIIGSKGEYGWDGWLGAYFVNDPSTKTTFIMLVQRFDYGTGPLTRKLRNIIFS